MDATAFPSLPGKQESKEATSELDGEAEEIPENRFQL